MNYSFKYKLVTLVANLVQHIFEGEAGRRQMYGIFKIVFNLTSFS